jgi:sugar (pentulose or hexulose) kinase
MTEPPLIGIHLGTASVDVGVYNHDGAQVAAGQAPVSEQTTVAWERALREAIPDFAEAGGICSVASTSGTAVLVDRYGEPVFSPQMYYDSVSVEPSAITSSDRLGGLKERDIALSPTGPLPKIITLRETYPERFERVEWILCPATWLLYRLHMGSSTQWNDVETDWSNALKFGADVSQSLPEWRTDLLDALDLSRSLFPAIRPPGSFLGAARSEIAERTGLDGARLFQGLTDGTASMLASGCLEPGDFSITFGASSVVKYVSESISPHDALYYHRHPVDGYLPGAAFDTGNVLRWVFSRVLNCTPERGMELARATASGSEYEVFLKGDRSPFFDGNVGSSILGMRNDRHLSTEEVQGRIARGLATSIVLTEWVYISLIEEHFDTPIEAVRLINDDAPSLSAEYAWWNDLRASIWDRPVVEMEPRTTAGLLIPATLINSVYPSADEAATNLLREQSVIQPSDPSTDYERRKETYLNRWRRLATLYRQ